VSLIYWTSTLPCADGGRRDILRSAQQFVYGQFKGPSPLSHIKLRVGPTHQHGVTPVFQPDAADVASATSQSHRI